MKETVVTFGPGDSLVGILTEPTSVPRSPVTVVMSNVGLNHRVGPSRVWVDLARRVARHGIASLRFDASGLGDSAPRNDLLSDIERSVLDLKDALAWLAARNHERFILVSLCSGTDNAHRVAVEDPRVTGVVFLDGYTYTTPVFLLHRYVLRWMSRQHWRRALRRRFPRAFDLDLGKHGAGEIEDIFQREYPSREQFEADLAKLVARKAKLLFVFSGETMYAYRDQFWGWVKHENWREQIEIEYFPRANHTYTFRTERDQMLDRTAKFVVSISAKGE